MSPPLEDGLRRFRWLRGMSKSLAWTFAGLDLRARRAAEYAAQREGVSLEDWLSEAIEERAVGAIPRYRERDCDIGRERAPWRRRDEASREPDRGVEWVAAIESLSRRIEFGERRAQRAFESIAFALERAHVGDVEASQAAPAAQEKAAKRARDAAGPIAGAPFAGIEVQDPLERPKHRRGDAGIAWRAAPPSRTDASAISARRLPRSPCAAGSSTRATAFRARKRRRSRRRLPPGPSPNRTTIFARSSPTSRRLAEGRAKTVRTRRTSPRCEPRLPA